MERIMVDTLRKILMYAEKGEYADLMEFATDRMDFFEQDQRTLIMYGLMSCLEDNEFDGDVYDLFDMMRRYDLTFAKSEIYEDYEDEDEE